MGGDAVTPLKRQNLQASLKNLDTWLAPHLKRRADLVALIEQPDDPFETEAENAAVAYAEAEEAIERWGRDQELCDGLGSPMHTPESLFQARDRARARWEKATEALRLARKES